MSARSSVTGPGFPPRSVAKHAGPPDAGANLVEAGVAQLALDERRRFELHERELGMRVKVTAVLDQLRNRRHGKNFNSTSIVLTTGVHRNFAGVNSCSCSAPSMN